jgi:hypothetical protein
MSRIVFDSEMQPVVLQIHTDSGYVSVYARNSDDAKSIQNIMAKKNISLRWWNLIDLTSVSTWLNGRHRRGI